MGAFNRTLVVLDDHEPHHLRVSQLFKQGFEHLFFDDNYPVAPALVSATDVYSLHSICSPLPPGTSEVRFNRVAFSDGESVPANSRPIFFMSNNTYDSSVTITTDAHYANLKLVSKY